MCVRVEFVFCFCSAGDATQGLSMVGKQGGPLSYISSLR